MKNKIIYFFISVLVCCTMACNKESIENDQFKKNTHRVKRMIVKTQGLDDEQIFFSYNATGKLMRAYRCGISEKPGKPLEDGTPTINRDTLGYMGKSINEIGDQFLINDYLVNIDQDSINRLKAEFPTVYKDSIMKRRVARSSYSLLFSKQNTDLNKEETQIIYKVRTDFGLGQNFNNKMLNNVKNVYKYEYNSNLQPLIVRFIKYMYKDDIKLNEEFEKMTYKIEFAYRDNLIQSAMIYKLVVGMDENWVKDDSYTYSYSNGKLMNIDGANYKLTRSANLITIIKNGTTEIYTLNDSDNVIKIEYAGERVIEVEYESGSGDFGNLYTTTYSTILGVPIIR